MIGQRPTRRELEEALDSMTYAVSFMSKNMKIMKFNYDAILKENEEFRRKLAYYENSNSPPSANSLEWKKRKRGR